MRITHMLYTIQSTNGTGVKQTEAAAAAADAPAADAAVQMFR